MRVWAAAYLHTKNADVRKQIGAVFNTVLDAQIARAKKYGFVPFTFEVDVKGKSPGKSAPGQSMRLAHHAVELGLMMALDNKVISQKLAVLAALHIPQSRAAKALLDAQGRLDGGIPFAPTGAKPKPVFRDLSKNNTPSASAREIVRYVKLYRKYKDKAYLEVARKQGVAAHVRFMDATCPLPKAYSGGRRKTAEGEGFPDFYFRGAELMGAFALLGEALKP
jgi:hypothetical protein